MSPYHLTVPQVMPLELSLPVVILLALVGYYIKTSPYFATERQRAYLLSTCSSAIMTCCSMPFFLSYSTYGLKATFEGTQNGWMAELARVGTIFFGVYLFADLAVGYVNYRSQVGMLTGWIHHTVYIALMIYLLNTRLAPLFMTGAIMELPTFDLAISNLYPSLRSDERFLSSFLIFRIIFNIVFFIDCGRPSSIRALDGSYVPVVMAGLALVMHASWFHAGVKGYLKRRAKAPHAKEVDITAEVEKENTVISTATAINHLSVPSAGFTSAIDGEEPPTPDESPLITPRTPRFSPFPSAIRDAYLPNITLSIPTVNIPSVNLPPLSSIAKMVPKRPADVDFNFGFKDAVRTRWEEQRGRFGLGMGMGVRRRKGVEEEEGAKVRIMEVQGD